MEIYTTDRLMVNPPKIHIETQGCKLNQSDSEDLNREFLSVGFETSRDAEDANVIVLNTCTVTHIADRKARQRIRSLKRVNPDSVVVVTGCYAENKPEVLEEMPEIDLVVGNTQKNHIIGTVLDKFFPNLSSHDLFPQFHFSEFSSRNRAMVKIQEGCDQICAYCIVPKVRGRERSIPVNTIVSKINTLNDMGYKEVVLTGTQLGTYGFDLVNTTISDLISAIIDNTDIPRIRVSSLQPHEITEELLEFWTNRRLCPHFHIPLQSGSDNVLGNMRRRYSSDTFMSSLNTVKSSVKNVAITTDVIVGFPGETLDDFKQTREICLKSGFSDLHVFKFSRRPGTSAFYVCDDVSPSEKSSRSSEIIAIGKESYKTFRENYEGSKLVVLWEGIGKNVGESRALNTGLTENYIRVKSMNKTVLPNYFSNVTVKIDPKNVYGPMLAFEGE